MQEIDDLRQAFLGLIFSGDICKCHAGILLDVDLGVALSDAHDPAAADPAHHKVHKQQNHHEGKDKAQKRIQDRRSVRPFPGNIHACLVKAGDQIAVLIHPDGIKTDCLRISAGPRFRLDLDLGVPDHDRIHFSLIDHFEEMAIGNLSGTALTHLAPHEADDSKGDQGCKGNDQKCLSAVHSAAVSVIRAFRCRIVSVIHSDFLTPSKKHFCICQRFCIR